MKITITQLVLLIGSIILFMGYKMNSNMGIVEFEKEKIRQTDIAWAKTEEARDLDGQTLVISKKPIEIRSNVF